MKRILILGAHSYIGTSLERRLCSHPERFSAQTLSLHGVALESLDFRGADVMVQVAAIVHQREHASMASLYEAVNRDLAIAAARKAKAEGVRQFVFFSTVSVYGKITGTIAKDTPLHPATLYGRTKLEAERAIAALCDDTFTVTILRPPMVIGNGVKGNYHQLEQLIRYLPFCPDFENRRSLVRIETLCSRVAELIEHPQAGIFFPQEAEPIATRDLIEMLAKQQGRTLKRTKWFNPAIRVFRCLTRTGKKAFGDLVFDGLSELPLSTVIGQEAQP